MLDIHNCSVLTDLKCNNNNLSCLNVKNGVIPLPFALDARNNPDLQCVNVDDVWWSNNYWIENNQSMQYGYVDPQSFFSTDCQNNCVSGIVDIQNSDERKVIKIIDLSGREIEKQKNILMIYIFDDGSTEKVLELE
jgi:hypothetical protein